MSRLIKLLLVPAVILIAVWYVGETLIADRVKKILVNDGAITGQVSALRDPARFGVGLEGLHLIGATWTADLPRLELAARSTRPNQFAANLPDSMTLTVLNQPLTLGLANPAMELDLSPLTRMAPKRLLVTADQITLDGTPVVDDLRIAGNLLGGDSESPEGAQAGYDLDLRLGQLDAQAVPAALPPALAALGPLSVEGQARLWLDDVPTPTNLAAGITPAVRGLSTDRFSISLGKARFDLSARIAADDGGTLDGPVAIYTRDAQLLIDNLQAAEVITSQQAVLMMGFIRNAANSTSAAVADAFPDAAPEELRLMAELHQSWLQIGGVPVLRVPAMPQR